MVDPLNFYLIRIRKKTPATNVAGVFCEMKLSLRELVAAIEAVASQTGEGQTGNIRFRFGNLVSARGEVIRHRADDGVENRRPLADEVVAEVAIEADAASQTDQDVDGAAREVSRGAGNLRAGGSRTEQLEHVESRGQTGINELRKGARVDGAIQWSDRSDERGRVATE